eukprot:12408995-Karenia_brevis.AAC.1
MPASSAKPAGFAFPPTPATTLDAEEGNAAPFSARMTCSNGYWKPWGCYCEEAINLNKGAVESVVIAAPS